jgi:hypothetical protein
MKWKFIQKFRKSRSSSKPEKLLKKFPVWQRIFVRVGRAVKHWFRRQAKKHRDFMSRRPHRSLKLTRRRDYKRSLKLPGYFAFSSEVWKMIWQNKKIFICFIILYSILSLVLVGALNQGNYVALRDQLNDVGEDLGISKITSLFVGAISSGNGQEATMTSQIIAGLLMLMGWLIVVWILRRRMAGDKIRLRDALYSAGSPIIATCVLLLIIVLQLLPLALVLLAYSSMTGVGIINMDIDIENMAAWCALAGAAVLTLYWLATSFIALIIVTNPGVYPFQAMKMAGDMVVGRRLRVMLRLLFMVVPMLLMWIIILVPVILLDDWIKVDWLPLVPLTSLILMTLTLTWVASYIYILYRRMMDDKSPPAKR